MEFQDQFEEIRDLINSARHRTFHSVNRQLIDLYWAVGQHISVKIDSSVWGKSVVNTLSTYIQDKDPQIKGFSAQNLWRMKQLYETYRHNPILSPLVRELSWSNNLLIMGKSDKPEEQEFYLKLAISEKYTKRELERQIDSGLFERIMISKQNLSPPVREVNPVINNLFRDTYVLEFLDLPEVYLEQDVRKGIVKNLRKFILEFGKDFSLVGQEYKIQVGGSDFFIDLLFYQRELQCLVAVELKTTKFKPEYVGKMEFYLEALDRDVKKQKEEPSVGIILCTDKDNKVVEYALNRSLSPTMVSRYQTQLIDKKILAEKLIEFMRIAEMKNENKR